jgi:hypothetical protein
MYARYYNKINPFLLWFSLLINFLETGIKTSMKNEGKFTIRVKSQKSLATELGQ